MSKESPMQRVKSFMEQSGINPHLFAKTIGVPYTTLLDNLNGRTDPKMSTLTAISKQLGLSLNWIIMGYAPVKMADIDPHYHAAYPPKSQTDETLPQVEPQDAPKVNDTYNISIGHSTQTIEQPSQPAPAILVKQLIEQNHQLYQQNVLLMDQNRSLSEQLIKLISK